MDVATLRNGKGDEALWYKIPGSKAEVQIQAIKPHRLKEIRKACTSKRLLRGVWIENRDEEKLEEMMLQEAVINWKDVKDSETNEPFPVTPENKQFLSDNWTEFYHLWNGVVVRQAEVDGSILEAESKN